MTHTLAAVAKRDLVKPLPHEQDGRSKLIYLTMYGRTYHQGAIEGLGPAVEALKDKLYPQSMTEIVPELQKIRAIQDSNRDN